MTMTTLCPIIGHNDSQTFENIADIMGMLDTLLGNGDDGIPENALNGARLIVQTVLAACQHKAGMSGNERGES